MASFASLPGLAAGGITDINPGLTLWTGHHVPRPARRPGQVRLGPIVKMLDERERTIREAIESAKKERAEAERMLAEQKSSLAQAQREAAELARRNQQEVEVLRQELTARARKEADELVAGAPQQIEEEKTKAMAELRGMVADLAIDAASRLVKANLDDASQRELVEDYIAQLPANRAA